MNNFVQDGDNIDFTAGAAYDGGDPVLLGELIGFVVATVASGSVGVAKIKGVFNAPKVSAQAWAVGDRIYWDDSGSLFTNVRDTDVHFAGYAVEIAANPSSTGKLLLTPNATPQAALVAFSAGSNLVGVDGMGSNAAPVAGTETRLDAIDTALLAILVALKNAGLMADA